jgi:hypothetical protein
VGRGWRTGAALMFAERSQNGTHRYVNCRRDGGHTAVPSGFLRRRVTSA